MSIKVWAKAGDSAQFIQIKKPNENYILMVGLRPDGHYIAAANGDWVIDEKGIIAEISNSVQGFMDSKAQAKGYDSIFTAVTYADEPIDLKFKADGVAFREWRSLCWRACYDLLDDWRNGLLADPPTSKSVIASLPELNI